MDAAIWSVSPMPPVATASVMNRTNKARIP